MHHSGISQEMRYLLAKICPAAYFCSYNLGISVLLLRSSKAVIAQIYQEAAYIRPRKGLQVELQSVPPQRRKTHACHVPGEMDFLCFMFWVMSLHSMYTVLLYATTIKVSKTRIVSFTWKVALKLLRKLKEGGYVSHQLQEAQSQKLLVLKCAKEIGILKSLIGIITYHHIPVLVQT